MYTVTIIVIVFIRAKLLLYGNIVLLHFQMLFQKMVFMI